MLGGLLSISPIEHIFPCSLVAAANVPTLFTMKVLMAGTGSFDISGLGNVC